MNDTPIYGSQAAVGRPIPLCRWVWDACCILVDHVNQAFGYLDLVLGSFSRQVGVRQFREIREGWVVGWFERGLPHAEALTV